MQYECFHRKHSIESIFCLGILICTRITPFALKIEILYVYILYKIPFLSKQPNLIVPATLNQGEKTNNKKCFDNHIKMKNNTHKIGTQGLIAQSQARMTFYFFCFLGFLDQIKIFRDPSSCVQILNAYILFLKNKTWE